MIIDCTNPDDQGTSGWSNWRPDDESWCGCGLFYDCCAVIVPVACMGSDCNLRKAGVCTLKPPEKTDKDIWEEKMIMYVHEYLFKVKIDKDTEGIYGHDWQLPKSERPPLLAQIPDLEG